MRLLVAAVAGTGGWMLTNSYERKSRLHSLGVGLIAFAGSVVVGEVIPW